MIPAIISFTGFVAFVCALFLSLRMRFLVRRLGGIAAQYRLHHYSGFLCIIAVLLHVVSQFASLGGSAWRSLLDLSDPGLLAGWMALTLLLGAFAAVWLKKLPYRAWRFIHMLFIPAFFILLIHIWLFVPASGIKPWLAGVFGTSGIIILLVLLFNHFIPFQYREFTIAGIRELGGQIFEIDLSPRTRSGQVPDYPAGQIVYVRFNVPGFTRGWHPFSVASCRVDTMLRLVVKSFGHDTQLIPQLTTGDHVSVAGPYAEFKISPGESQVWIAGGIGLAPFLGMTRCLKVMPYSTVHLFYFVNSAAELTCKAELDATARSFANFSWHPVVLPRGATISGGTIALLAQLKNQAQYLVCGPPGFMRLVRKTLVRSGITRKHVHTEEFSTW